jgi:hypothetical protein
MWVSHLDAHNKYIRWTLLCLRRSARTYYFTSEGIMDIERLKQSALVPLIEPRVEQVWELPHDIVDVINTLITELNAEGYPITIDHIVSQALHEWFEVDRTKEYEEIRRRLQEDSHH